jgi:hypothetical protein
MRFFTERERPIHLGKLPVLAAMSKRFCSNREASELFRLGSVILSLRLHGMYSGYAFHSQRAGANLCSTPWANRSRRVRINVRGPRCSKRYIERSPASICA